jgi:hypothetical protein
LIDGFRTTHRTPIIAIISGGVTKLKDVIVQRSWQGPQALLAAIAEALES